MPSINHFLFRNIAMLKYVLPLLLALSCAAYADETAVRERLQKNHPQLEQQFGNIEQVNKSPVPGLYEVVVPGRLFYTDEEGNYLINGAIWDLRTMHNITEEREKKVFAVDFKTLPFDLAIKEVKGNGKRKMMVFTDPNCGYCKRLEGELQKIDNVTIYRLMFPIFEGSDVKARNVWCSKNKNKTKTWTDMMIDGVMPPAATDPKCTYPVAKAQEWGKRLRVNGTPALFFADGTMNPGALPAEDIEKALDEAAQKQ
jgi:thiol:disulfide interchange protein DsbC